MPYQRLVVCPECGEEFIPELLKRGRKPDPWIDDLVERLRFDGYVEFKAGTLGLTPLALRSKIRSAMRYRGERVSTRILDSGTVSVERLRP